MRRGVVRRGQRGDPSRRVFRVAAGVSRSRPVALTATTQRDSESASATERSVSNRQLRPGIGCPVAAAPAIPAEAVQDCSGRVQAVPVTQSGKETAAGGATGIARTGGAIGESGTGVRIVSIYHRPRSDPRRDCTPSDRSALRTPVPNPGREQGSDDSPLPESFSGWSHDGRLFSVQPACFFLA